MYPILPQNALDNHLIGEYHRSTPNVCYIPSHSIVRMAYLSVSKPLSINTLPFAVRQVHCIAQSSLKHGLPPVFDFTMRSTLSNGPYVGWTTEITVPFRQVCQHWPQEPLAKHHFEHRQ